MKISISLKLYHKINSLGGREGPILGPNYLADFGANLRLILCQFWFDLGANFEANFRQILGQFWADLGANLGADFAGGHSGYSL
jgi:hypothetical protein